MEDPDLIGEPKTKQSGRPVWASTFFWTAGHW
ncbi:hypothetical protein PhaeoP23_01933 [Phaeobacter piscinae]|uniref:Transposase n=1 Tax=Phaeobacter piscinae TaxID=1580596 RepID=A0ABM6PE74_9RHOB|nr:hypothetical protein PhaeoP36_01933 [Phaeobacter piscinae]ATG39951.1 hypothetical protein PhaeoP14_01858 [Phaeobacter piscinae]AUQ86589.1 hypothetical protein PhaeoP42_01934 [Phaeobacter piscinae]AUR24472.1 hypothetical protein PhaeoP23_01933 [Phaeobacter piscinae]